MRKEPSVRPDRIARKRPLDVAIIGMGCRFPGARDLFAFWKNVVEGRDCTREVPRNRWDVDTFFEPDSQANDRVSCRRGGYLDEPIDFDPTRYGIMPLAVEGGEPEQFLVLDAAKAALDDAGMSAGVPDGRRVEVVIGRGNYFNRGNLTRLQHGRGVAQTLAVLRAIHPEWSEADFEAVRADLKASLPPFEAGTIPGQITNATASRVADRINLSGASYVVDAASASALVALDLGARALAERRADLSIVGGVYLQPDVDFPLVFSRLGALSKSGQARPFARAADGTLPGEGVGVVVLKRLADAERDGDRVYAVLKGVGLASDGRGPSLTAPSAHGHARAIRRAYRDARIDPATVGLIEGHGLGVPASDRAELRALRSVFPRPKRGKRALTAVSALIGHAMPAAGMAGLIKTALALHHRVLPPTPHADDPHPLLADDASPFALNARVRPWVHGDTASPRRAGVNAFGFAGINAHAVLEEHAASADGATPGCMTEWETEAILLGAPDRTHWLELARALLAWLDAGQNALVPLKDLAATLNTGQADFPFRVGMVVESTSDLRTRLVSLVERLNDPKCRSVRDAKGTYFWEERLGGPGRLAFLFPGEGSQYPGMLADLCPHFPELRGVFDTSDRVAIVTGHEHLPSEQLFGNASGEGSGLWAIETAVNVVLSSQWALYQLLKKLGLRPDAVVGHSSGEFLALAAAGVIRSDRAFEDRLGELGSVFERLEKAGLVPSATLVAVAADRERVRAACREAGGDVVIAIDNCPHQVVVAGDPEVVEAVVTRLRSEGVFCEPLPYNRAYHTPRFSSALAPVRAFFDGLTLNKPATPIYSCAEPGRMGDDVETIRRLAVDQWVSPVAFRATVEAMHADGVRLFVDVGARGNLIGFVEDTLRGRPHYAVASNVPRRSGITQLNHLVASLYAQGVGVRPDHLYARRRPLPVDLSTDYTPPKTGQPLAVGFPEMRLSEALVERLRKKHQQHDVAPANGTGGEGANGSLPRRNGQPHQHHDHGVQSAVATAAINGKTTSNGHATPPVNRAFGPHLRNGEAASSDPASEAMLLDYFKTMDAFLETQRQVMEAYLGSRGSMEPADEIEFLPDRHEPPEPVAESTAVTEVLPEEPSAPAALDVRTLLLEQVSRRTGYPLEMLDLDFDMEADLGIDSIKRVEILGELQTLGLGSNSDMEKLSRCRTLGQVVSTLEQASPRRATAVEIETPWVGEIERLVPGRELVAVRWLDATADPVAEHHTLGGRRISALQPERLGLPVVPFTVMAELLAQAAAVLMPGQVVVGLRDVQANRWLPYGESPVALELHAERALERPREVRVRVKNRGTQGSRKTGADETTVEGVVVFGETRKPGPAASEFSLTDSGPCRLTAEELYGDQWLFHGPALQAMERVGASAPDGIEGTLRVLPRRDLLPERLWPKLHTDPIVLDAFTHLLGSWGIDKKAGEEGDVMFPLRLSSLSIYGDDPPEGTPVECRIRVHEVTRHRVKADAELITPDGKVWLAFKDWEDWRFYWPGRYRDVFRSPDTVLLGERLKLPGLRSDSPDGLTAVWLEPPADMGKPVWRDVLEWTQLAPDERKANRARAGSDLDLTLSIWGRIAAKEAVRRVWLSHGGSTVYPADYVIETGPDGRHRMISRVEPQRDDLPALAFAHAEGVAVALSALDPTTTLGIDVAPVRPIAATNASTTTDGERLWLEQNTRPGTERGEWTARLMCARGAVQKAAGSGLTEWEIVEADSHTGEVILRLDGRLIRCMTALRGEYVWAWTALERTDP